MSDLLYPLRRDLERAEADWSWAVKYSGRDHPETFAAACHAESRLKTLAKAERDEAKRLGLEYTPQKVDLQYTEPTPAARGNDE